ncbi:PUM-HD domain-containing protein [Heracleum sosnowskyi]|uniref:PUM-HD domain-containing protein n=1 Tax=Heracleum sosnowskyi TaxID=360622 RepID=A0AAD8IDD1_9APIA|nr:PUM-HD domain-containing protein [Heracleum sosnowskyi]
MVNGVLCRVEFNLLQYGDWSNSVHRPQVQCVDWSNSSVYRPQVLDHTSNFGRYGSGENLFSRVPSVRNSVGTSTYLEDERMRTNPVYECSGMYNVANQFPGIPMQRDAASAYDPWDLSGYTTSRNGYYGPGLTQTRSNGQNRYHNQENLLLGGNQEHKTTILKGALDHIYQLLMDQYGHHMIDKLVESSGEYELQKILEKLAAEPDLLVTAACSKEGSSSLQKLIKHLKKSPQRFCLTSALAPNVVDLATNKTARHVFRECLNLLGSQANKVLYEEAIKNFDTLARDEVGCLALNDCIDFATNYFERERILQLVIENTVSLAYDPYGNYIVQNAVKIPECGDQICRKLRGHYIYLSTKKSGSHVVEKCMEACSSAVMQGIEEILEKKQALELACNEYGNYVIQTALRATQVQNCNIQLRNSLVKALLPGLDRLKDTRAGRNLANKILDLASPRRR